MSLWLPGAKIIKGSDSGVMLGGPRKVVWHTTENDPTTTTASNVAKYLVGSGNTVHIVWNPLSGEIVQMIPANRGGKGLENRAGGVQTNRGGTYVIQIEVVGRASQPFTNGPMVGLAKIQAWLTALGIPAVWSGTPDRSTANWAKGGHFGHADVPENSHWDPGAINKAKLTTTRTTPSPPSRATVRLPLKPPSKPFPLPAGHWFGMRSPDPRNHSGANPADRPAIKAIQGKVGVLPDGDFGANTRAHVIRWQTAHNLPADGAAGALTWAALHR